MTFDVNECSGRYCNQKYVNSERREKIAADVEVANSEHAKMVRNHEM